jgi:hypothetical protein
MGDVSFYAGTVKVKLFGLINNNWGGESYHNATMTTL